MPDYFPQLLRRQIWCYRINLSIVNITLLNTGAFQTPSLITDDESTLIATKLSSLIKIRKIYQGLILNAKNGLYTIFPALFKSRSFPFIAWLQKQNANTLHTQI